MKTLALLIGALALAFIFLNPQKTQSTGTPRQSGADKSSIAADPIQAMAELRSYVPKAINIKGPNDFQGMADIGYDVKKTDSLVNPLLGLINFNHSGLDMQIVLHWKQNHWVFSRLICLENGNDFTNVPGGLEIINSTEMQPFMARCR